MHESEYETNTNKNRTRLQQETHTSMLARTLAETFGISSQIGEVTVENRLISSISIKFANKSGSAITIKCDACINETEIFP